MGFRTLLYKKYTEYIIQNGGDIITSTIYNDDVVELKRVLNIPGISQLLKPEHIWAGIYTEDINILNELLSLPNVNYTKLITIDAINLAIYRNKSNIIEKILEFIDKKLITDNIILNILNKHNKHLTRKLLSMEEINFSKIIKYTIIHFKDIELLNILLDIDNVNKITLSDNDIIKLAKLINDTLVSKYRNKNWIKMIYNRLLNNNSEEASKELYRIETVLKLQNKVINKTTIEVLSDEIRSYF
jgi:hypothetical protein